MLEAEEALRRHRDEGSRGRIECLAPQEVEELAGCRAVRDPDVVLRALLQEPLQPCARVLPAVPWSPCGRRSVTGRVTPLRAARDEKLVDHDLGAVDEVAELRLPEDG